MNPSLSLAKAVRIEGELSRRGVKLSRSGPELIGPCPVCGGTDRFGVHTKKQVWNCRQCQKGGDVIALVMHVDGSEFKDAISLLAGASLVRPRAMPRETTPGATDQDNDKSKLAQFLWQRSAPAAGTVVQAYLSSRRCWIPSLSLRYLPGRNSHPPAMIARMGSTGVHLTKLKPDGSGKAGTDKDKIMIGPSMGHPIIVHDNPDRGELIITEGIEDAASVALVTGWNAWAAGSAGRIAPLMEKATRFEKVFVAVDRDRAAEHALRKAQQVRPDVIPLRFAKLLSIREPLDANRALIKFGSDAILAAMEWAEAQCAFGCERITYEQMREAQTRANGVFMQMAG